jgi:hypothetical protein
MPVRMNRASSPIKRAGRRADMDGLILTRTKIIDEGVEFSGTDGKYYRIKKVNRNYKSNGPVQGNRNSPPKRLPG